MAARSMTLPPDLCRRESRMTSARIASSSIRRHSDLALSPHEPCLSGRNLVARMRELAGGVILARSSRDRLGTNDHETLPLSRFVDLLDGPRVSPLASAGSRWSHWVS